MIVLAIVLAYLSIMLIVLAVMLAVKFNNEVYEGRDGGETQRTFFIIAIIAVAFASATIITIKLI